MPSAGYWRSRPSCTVGRRPMLSAASTTCTTSYAIRPSCWWAGFACVVTRVRAPLGWTVRQPLYRGGAWGGRVPHGTAGGVERPQLPACAHARAGDPKAGGKSATWGSRLSRSCGAGVLKLVLEPIFEADFQPCSYGFRPKRRAHDAVAEVRHSSPTPMSGSWRATSKPASMKSRIGLDDRVRARVGDKRVWPW